MTEYEYRRFGNKLCYHKNVRIYSKNQKRSYCTVVNNATTTGAGTVLDGRMGKTLMDRLLQDSSLLQTVLNNLIRSDKTIGSAYAVTATYRSNAYLTTVYWNGTH